MTSILANNRKDLTGKVFGRLTVLQYSHTTKFGQACWLCRCVCGNEVSVLSGNLKRGNTTSCGCFRKEQTTRPVGMAMFNRVYYTYRKNATNRGIEFDLSKDDVYKLVSMDCFYCGEHPSNISKRKISNGDFIYNGIDRLDSSKGYFLDNVVPCCYACNKAKMDTPYQQFKSWLFKASNFMSAKEINSNKTSARFGQGTI